MFTCNSCDDTGLLDQCMHCKASSGGCECGLYDPECCPDCELGRQCLAAFAAEEEKIAAESQTTKLLVRIYHKLREERTKGDNRPAKDIVADLSRKNLL